MKFKVTFFCLTVMLAPMLLVAATPTDTPTATPTASPTPSPTVTQTAVCGSTFGCVTCTADLGNNPPYSSFTTSQYVLPGEGTVNQIAIYLTGTTGALFRTGIYSDNANRPASLIVESPQQNTVEGWNFFTVNPTYLVAGNYWIALVSQPGRVHWRSNTASRSMEFSFTYGPLPNPVPTETVGFGTGFLFYASYCPGPPLFFTPTPTVTATPTPLQYQAAPQGKLVLGPVPAKQGEKVCLYFDQAPASSEWEVFNVRGQRVSALSFGLGEQACWDTSKTAPGLYIVRAKVGYVGGTRGEVTQKVVVVR